MSESLLSPVTVGTAVLSNRVVMAPMTRSRSLQPGDVPGPLNATYYAQRASAGLIITEGTQVSPSGKGYAFTPGIYSTAQINGWKAVTDEVHRAGGRIAAQLWHVGRLSHRSLQPEGAFPLAPSAIRAQASVFVMDDQKQGHMAQADTPVAMTLADISAVQEQFVEAAKNARLAGFDFVEVHAANGYLFAQFLAQDVNQRSDQYGGSLENRARFLLETLDAMVKEVGADFIGVRLSPWCPINGMQQEPGETMTLYLAEAFQQRNLAWIHLAEWGHAGGKPLDDAFRQALRTHFRNTLIVCGGYDASNAEQRLQQGTADMVAFGRPFIANPDLVARMRTATPLAQADSATFYGGNETGYTDYPVAS